MKSINGRRGRAHRAVRSSFLSLESPISILTRAARAIIPSPDELHGPLVPLLLVLTMVTGLVDSVSFLRLGHVSVANMTGNIVSLGFGVADARGFSISASIAAIVVSALTLTPNGEPVRYTLIVLLAVAMGMQNAIARRLGVPDLTTTVLTFTLTGIAADSRWAGGRNPRRRRRIVATGTMFFGAAVGALLAFNVGVSAVLALTVALLGLNGVVAYRVSSSSAAWTAAN